jgi:hypothetical protein
MAKYRKKPVVIDAWLFSPGQAPKPECVGTSGENKPVGWNPFVCTTQEGKNQIAVPPMHGWIETLEGTMLVSPGDYIIKGIKGEYYPCKPEIFSASYEPADEVKPDPSVVAPEYVSRPHV